MLSNVTLGRFFPGDSFVHKLDPRIKIVSTVLLLISIFLSASYLSLFLNLTAVLVFVVLTKIPLKTYLKSMKFVFFVVLFTSVLNIFLAKGAPVLQIGQVVITKEGIDNSIFVSMRLVILILVSSLLTFTTSPTSLTDALECLLKPLSLFKVKTHELALMMTIALRFIPTLLEETDKIKDAQKARGVDMETGSIFKRIKAFVPVLVPLFVLSFKRAYDLALAMECRCYRGGEGRTHMRILCVKLQDIITLFVVLSLVLVTILINMCFSAVVL